MSAEAKAYASLPEEVSLERIRTVLYPTDEIVFHGEFPVFDSDVKFASAYQRIRRSTGISRNELQLMTAAIRNHQTIKLRKRYASGENKLVEESAITALRIDRKEDMAMAMMVTKADSKRVTSFEKGKCIIHCNPDAELHAALPIIGDLLACVYGNMPSSFIKKRPQSKWRIGRCFVESSTVNKLVRKAVTAMEKLDDERRARRMQKKQAAQEAANRRPGKTQLSPTSAAITGVPAKRQRPSPPATPAFAFEGGSALPPPVDWQSSSPPPSLASSLPRHTQMHIRCSTSAPWLQRPEATLRDFPEQPQSQAFQGGDFPEQPQSQAFQGGDILDGRGILDEPSNPFLDNMFSPIPTEPQMGGVSEGLPPLHSSPLAAMLSTIPTGAPMGGASQESASLTPMQETPASLKTKLRALTVFDSPASFVTPPKHDVLLPSNVTRFTNASRGVSGMSYLIHVPGHEVDASSLETNVPTCSVTVRAKETMFGTSSILLHSSAIVEAQVRI